MGRWGWAPPPSPHGHVKVAIYSKTPEGGEEEREGGGWRVEGGTAAGTNGEKGGWERERERAQRAGREKQK